MNNKLQYWIELNRVKLFYKITTEKIITDLFSANNFFKKHNKVKKFFFELRSFINFDCDFSIICIVLNKASTKYKVILMTELYNYLKDCIKSKYLRVTGLWEERKANHMGMNDIFS